MKRISIAAGAVLALGLTGLKRRQLDAARTSVTPICSATSKASGMRTSIPGRDRAMTGQCQR